MEEFFNEETKARLASEKKEKNGDNKDYLLKRAASLSEKLKIEKLINKNRFKMSLSNLQLMDIPGYWERDLPLTIIGTDIPIILDDSSTPESQDIDDD